MASAAIPRPDMAEVAIPVGVPASSSSASRCFVPSAELAGLPSTESASSPAAVIAAIRVVLCASARPPRAIGGSSAGIVSPTPAA
jgi:hypothetical protein